MMKKVAIILMIAVFLTAFGCTSINLRYTDSHISYVPDEDYYDTQDYYTEYLMSPYHFWLNFSWWNPFYHFGILDFYYPFFSSYYSPYYYWGWGFNSYWTENLGGGSVIHKKNLTKRRIKTISGNSGSSGSTVSKGKSGSGSSSTGKSTVTKSGVTKSKGSSTSSRSSSGGSKTRKKK